MHSIRILELQCHRFNIYRKGTSLLKKYITSSLQTCSINKYSTDSLSTGTENRQFKAAVLQPKKQNLTIETLVLPDVIEEKNQYDGMMRIGIDYCAIDNSDVKCIYQDINSITLPFIPGSEYSGEVLEIGPKCQKQFHVGDKVAVLGAKHIGGGLSHECIVPETECTKIKPGIPQKDAATIIQGYANALFAFSEYAPIEAGDNIVICAGPGGDGLAAIEIAHKIFNAKCYVVFSSTTVDGLLRDDAAQQAINCNVGLTKVYNFFKNTIIPKKFKVIYDTYDSKLLHVLSDFVSKDGYILTQDPFFSPDTFEPPYFKKTTAKKVKNQPVSLDEIEASDNIDWIKRVKHIDIKRLQTDEHCKYDEICGKAFELFEEGKIEPFISQTWNLRDVNKAVQFVNQKKCLGKVLVQTNRK